MITASNNLSPLLLEKYSRNILKIMSPTLVMQQFAERPDDIKKGEGQKIFFTMTLPHGKKAGDMTSINHGANNGKGTETEIPFFKQFSVEPDFFGDYMYAWNKDMKAGFISWIEAAVTAYGNWYKEGLDYKLTKFVMKDCYLLRADKDSNYEKDSTATHVATTTTIKDTTLTEANDYWKGAMLVVKTGRSAGSSTIVTDFDAATDTLTVSPAVPTALAVGDKYHICTTTNLIATDILTSAVARRAVKTLKKNKVPKLGGYYVGVVDPDLEADYITGLVTVLQYTEKGIKIMYNNEIGIKNGIRWVTASKCYQVDAALCAENEDEGLIHIAMVLGKGAYGTVPVDSDNKPVITVQNPISGKDDPHNEQTSIAVKVMYTPVKLNGMNVVGIACGVTI